MVNTCVIYGCQNRANRGEVGRSYHAVPKVILSQGDQTKDLSTKRRELWIARIERKDWTPSQYSNVCSDHFVTGKPSALYDRAHPDWAPSLKLRQESPAANVSENPEAGPSISLKRYARSAKRQKKKVEFETAQTLLNMSTSSVDSHQATDSVGLGENPICTFSLLGKLEHGPCGQEDNLNANNAPLMKKVRTEVQHLTTENMELREKVSSTKFTPEALSKQEDKLRYFTGLPGYLTLMQFFQLLEPYLTDSVKASLTKFEKLILVLRKLRLNLPIQDSVYCFNVSKPTVSWIFNSVIRIMYERLRCLIYWADRQHLQLTMPMEFRKSFGLKVAIIIDCFEIFIEQPSNLLARAETWSNYEHHNTIKFLIGITPQGAISFLSKAWGGRASDKKITENCELLSKLLPGDIVLADRGFDISESVGLMCAEVKIPAFTKGKSQLSPLDVETTRSIAHLRIHVERVIGLVRNKYTILQDTLPVDFLQSNEWQDPLVDKVVAVCCSLTNLCESVVPFD